MNQLELLDELDNSREQLLTTLDELSDDAMYQANTIDGQWSVADLLVHLTIWEAELVTALLSINRGQQPAKLLTAVANRDTFNTAQQVANLDRDLDRIFADLQQVRVQLEGWISDFTDKQLTDPQRYRWLKGRPLWHLIQEHSFGHELAHLPTLNQFSQQWLASTNLIAPADIPILGEDET